MHDSRNVPAGGAEGNIGGAERQYSGCERTVLRRNIAGIKEGDYSRCLLLAAVLLESGCKWTAVSMQDRAIT